MKILIFFFSCVVALYCFSCHQQPKSKPVAVVKKNVDSSKLKTADTLHKVLIIEPDLRALVDELNYYLRANDSIAAFGYYDPKVYRLRKSEIDSLLKNDESAEAKGKVQGSSLNPYLQYYADSLLRKVLNNKAIVKYSLDSILDMAVAVSPDKRLFSLSYAANTGGSYKERRSYIHYRPAHAPVLNYYAEEQNTDSLIFNTDGFYYIDTISAKGGIKYLLFGTIQGCNSCLGEYVQLAHFKNGKAAIDFSYNIDHGLYSEEEAIEFDAKTKKISVNLVPTKDELFDCDCNTSDARAALHSGYSPKADSLDVSSKLKTAKFLKCIFRFNGNTFVLDKKQSRVPQ
ncbi:hypothetical protein D0C36_04505 [Mucilaginibacter conchicola]|uniref:Uncharacterized protein n=1 Tax=Mucilaginibacter conchicola TaxID=2303333 RepID=A0A372NXN3_9SPHI|nr:hypothetical protein [Mucilaginibacter conchicola]RFZ94802.1 hypothetical protein D0C36_04505 [Mucilaginibacter conchicola]